MEATGSGLGAGAKPFSEPLTLEDWADLPEDEAGELVDGRLVEEEVPSYVHEIVVVWLASVLGAWVRPRGGFVAGSGGKFAVRSARGRMPDVTAFLAGRKPPPRGLVRIPPDIAIEVVSPVPSDERRDRVEKFDEYAAFGVRWYWLVDPERRTLEIYELVDARYARALGATEGVVDVPGCEGLRLDVDDLWREVERLGSEEPSET